MSGFLIFLGLVGFVVGLWGLIRGRVGWARIGSRKMAALALVGGFVLAGIGGAMSPAPAPKPTAAATVRSAASPKAPTPTASAPVVQAAPPANTAAPAPKPTATATVKPGAHIAATAPATTAPTAAKPPKAPVQPAATPKPKWTTVGQWSGGGMKQTQTFSVAGDQWRIKWSDTQSSDFGGIMQIMVYDDHGALVGLAANTQGNGADVSYMHNGPGKFYLQINAANVNWHVSVEDQQ